jgi:hypothetical protein
MVTDVNARVLVIGGGQIGIAAISALHRSGRYRFSVHCRTREGLARATASARRANLPVDSYSYGDLTTQQELVFSGGVLAREIRGTGVTALISALQPGLIIDSTSMATVLAGWDDQTAALDALMRYTIDAAEAAATTRSAFVKVSTTALGGMGLDIPFSHGDPSKKTLPPRMRAKLILSGAQLQMLWTMARTYPDERIHALIPAACVGFGHESMRLEMADSVISQNGATHTARPDPERRLTAVSAYAGEGPTYTRAELLLLAGPTSMGAVTSSEVGTVIARMLGGETRHDALRALQDSVLGPSAAGSRALQEAADWLARLEHELGAGAFVTGNLGGHVSQAMLGLAMISQILGPRWLEFIVSDKPAGELAARIADGLPDESALVAQLMAQRMVLADANGTWSFPYTSQERGVVDLCPVAISNWRETFKLAIDRRAVDLEAAPDWREALAGLLSDRMLRAQLRGSSCRIHNEQQPARRELRSRAS